MKNILIISPCFTPINTPDLHRIRLSIPHFIKMGYTITVIAVEPEFIEAQVDEVFKQQSDPCRVIRVKAFSAKTTRKFGLGNLGYRSWWQIFKAGNQLLNSEKFDLIYFSTTVFPIMTLGRIWKRKYGVPFVLDMQDPWRNDFFLTQKKDNRPPKYKIAHFLDSLLEKWTVPHCDGIVSVSSAYPETLNKRYNTNIPSIVIPFSASKSDFDLIEDVKLKNRFFIKGGKTINLVYTGAISPGMKVPLSILLKALKMVSEAIPEVNMKVFFIGTTYASGNMIEHSVLPIAKKLGIEDIIEEHPERCGFFEALRLIKDADILLLPGSLEAGYTASKIYPYILSGNPILSITHIQSSVAEILRGCNTGPVITFKNEAELLTLCEEICDQITHIILNLPYTLMHNWEFYYSYSELKMAKNQIDFFKMILNETKK